MQGDEEELKHAVAFVRPVSIAFQVVKDFRLYKSGVYTSDTCGNTPMVSYNFLTRWKETIYIIMHMFFFTDVILFLLGRMWTMLFLLLGMEWKTASHTGSSRTLGDKAGVTMATSRWSMGRICVVSEAWMSCDSMWIIFIWVLLFIHVMIWVQVLQLVHHTR